MIRTCALVLGLSVLGGQAVALELSLPASAQVTAQRNTELDRYAAPIGVFAASRVPEVTLDGAVRRSAWRIVSPGLTPLQVIGPLRQQLEQSDYRIVLDCGALDCGGYDFRFATEVLPGPNMYVNIRNYHFITALRGPSDAPVAAITVLASTTRGSAYVQIIEAGQLGEEAVITPSRDVPAPVAEPAVPALSAGDLQSVLFRDGHVVLQGLEFDTGVSQLGDGPFDALQKLADALAARPEQRIALVGHTDDQGSLDANIAISRDRARSVRQRLIEKFGIAASRIEAQGMGYLSPVASNLTQTGREANRRVEAVLLSE
ncbi:OmpA family protein [Sulfitobacter sp. S190]|uniref:OmpA family protein n=1 Tax=Sulfitobacter sp. S190 TaxID=2867022 RepID=UPI0021A28429|nr:OmpA family protein [Sulfitobacter sp. S190]UWR22737.1 OmpA family protein [Sulfitobacter sp. S190]